MQNNEELSHESGRKPTADDLARELSAPPRRSKIWGVPGEDQQTGELKLEKLALADVDPDPNQPRRYFDPAGLDELKKSIEARGQLNPVLVRPHPEQNGRYMLIGGERRYRVLKELGQDSILAIVRPANEQEARELALIDNLQRADLSPFEEAAGYQRLIDEFNYTQEQVAQTVGKDQTNVSMTLRLNTLPKKIRDDETSHKVSKSVLLELARVEDKKQQSTLWNDIRKDVKAGMPVTVRGIRAKRGIGQEPVAVPADKLALLSKAVSTLARQLDRVSSEELAANTVQQEALRTLRERLDSLLSSIPEQSDTQVTHNGNDAGQDAAQL
jgi:ParB family chromosome partitioning protein